MPTFEGMVKASDLLRVYPQTHLEDERMLEKVQKIQRNAQRGDHDLPELPPSEVLASRLSSLSRELVESRALLGHYAELIEGLEAKLVEVEQSCPPEFLEKLSDLNAWIAQNKTKCPKVPRQKTELLVKDTFLRLLAAQIKLIPSGHEFFAEGTGSILEAALNAGVAVNYGCTQGNCGACKARVVGGEVLKVRDHEYELSQTELNLGYMLMCSYTAVTDVTLEAGEAHCPADIAEQEIEVEIKQINRLNDRLLILKIQTPDTQTLRFMAGQDVVLSLEGVGQHRYPVASCPCDGKNLEFHIPRLEHDHLATYLFTQAQAKKNLHLKGPSGNFTLPFDVTAPLLLIAWETGFAPIKSLIEHTVSVDNAESWHLYWLTETSGEQMPGHYMHNLCRSWQDALDNFYYTPLHLGNLAINENDALDHYLQSTFSKLTDLRRYYIYVAMPEPLQTLVQDFLLSRQANPEHCFFTEHANTCD
ncbi:2Fe-2S iron-sulfur cluster-binding protein [Candidatus Venteria ishoeyi]|uniref:2Fe-2S iron-sulfur cluster-binding protein n=1 Tax=Candidatus Venteria ishoeyi TaxID=1899563 RepID=UPI0011B0C237|nr:2Fe-2S iron-sulfur cluster-binding protein [Candidatus Venteria ishoeyi]